MQLPISALGLDVGSRRIGVAGCDGTGLIATGLSLIQRRRLDEDIVAIQAWVERRQAQILVVGLPLQLDGTAGSQARKVQRFMQAVQKHILLPIDYVDERLTSVQAQADLAASGIGSRQQKGLIDQQAAAIILQDWLDARRSNASSRT